MSRALPGVVITAAVVLAAAAPASGARTYQYKVNYASLQIREDIVETTSGDRYEATSVFDLQAEKPPNATAFIKLKGGNDRGLASGPAPAFIYSYSFRQDSGGGYTCGPTTDSTSYPAQVLVTFDVRRRAVIGRWFIYTGFGGESVCPGGESYDPIIAAERYPRERFKKRRFTLGADGKRVVDDRGGPGGIVDGTLASDWDGELVLKRKRP